MENNIVSKYTISFGCSLTVSAVVNALLVVVKEKSPAVQAGLKKIAGHHWTGHSLVIIVLFLFLGWLLARFNQGRGPAFSANFVAKAVLAGVVAGTLIIIGFYLVAD